jgi:hypothetical protein
MYYTAYGGLPQLLRTLIQLVQEYGSYLHNSIVDKKISSTSDVPYLQITSVDTFSHLQTNLLIIKRLSVDTISYLQVRYLSKNRHDLIKLRMRLLKFKDVRVQVRKHFASEEGYHHCNRTINIATSICR